MTSQMGNRNSEICPDRYQLLHDSPFRDEHLAINSYLNQFITDKPPHEWNRDYPIKSEIGLNLLSSLPDAKVRLALALLDRMTHLKTDNEMRAYYYYIHRNLLLELLRSKLLFSEQQVLLMIEKMSAQELSYYVFSLFKAMVRQIEIYLQSKDISV
jgi:hypothetical protein